MTTILNNYSDIDKVTLIAEIWRTHTESSGWLLTGEMSISINDEFTLNIIDEPAKISRFCKKHNIQLLNDARTGVERYLDRLENAQIHTNTTLHTQGKGAV